MGARGGSKAIKNLVIALGVGGSIFLAGQIASAMVEGLDIASETTIMAIVIAGGLFAGLNATAGNRRTPTVSAALRDQALRFAPEAGSGYLVVLRRSRSGRRVGFDVMLDGEFVAQLMSPQFVVLQARSGTHSLFADIPRAPGRSSAEPLKLDVAQGSVQFFETRTAIGLTRTSVDLDPLVDTPGLRAYLGRTAMIQPVGA